MSCADRATGVSWLSIWHKRCLWSRCGEGFWGLERVDRVYTFHHRVCRFARRPTQNVPFRGITAISHTNTVQQRFATMCAAEHGGLIRTVLPSPSEGSNHPLVHHDDSTRTNPDSPPPCRSPSTTGLRGQCTAPKSGWSKRRRYSMRIPGTATWHREGSRCHVSTHCHVSNLSRPLPRQHQPPTATSAP